MSAIPPLKLSRDELAELARIVLRRTDTSSTAAADALIETVDELCTQVEIPRRLRDLGVRQEQIPDLVPASRGNSLSGNPREVTNAELQDLLESLW